MRDGLTKRKLLAAPDAMAGDEPFVCRDPRARHSPNSATRQTFERSPPRPDDLVALGLTLRQAEILAWLAFGKTDAEIGNILGISPRTVSHTIERIYRKLSVETRVAAAMQAMRVAPSQLPHGKALS